MKSSCLAARATPNPSLKRSANGGPPGPRIGAVYHPLRGPRRPTAGSRLARTLGAAGTTRRNPRTNDCIRLSFCYHPRVNSTHQKTLEQVLADPANGNIKWARIESMLKSAGCRVVEGAGSSVTFESGGRKMTLHRPHPGKEALRYRVHAVREFIEKTGIKP